MPIDPFGLAFKAYLEGKPSVHFTERDDGYIEETPDASMFFDSYDEWRARDLVTGKYTHDFPITADGVCELLGQCAQNELPREVYQLMDFYKMGKTRRAGIEYVPFNRPAQD